MLQSPASHKGFHIAHLNCQSMCNKFDIVKLHVSEQKFDIFSLSETWLNESLTSDLFEIDGFTLIRWDRSWKNQGEYKAKKGGGIAAYIRQGVKFSATELEQFNLSCSDIEMGWLLIRNPQQRKIIIGIIYRPPQSNAKNFTDILTDTTNRYLRVRGF